MTAALIIAIAGLFVAGALFTRLATRGIERAHPPVGRFIEVAGGRMHVLELGEDRPGEPPVVLLHGASSNLQDLQLALGEPLSARRRVILFDRPGHGWSERPGYRADAPPDRQADLIAQALERLGVARAIVLGHSFGCAVASALALNHPERVCGLVLVSPVSHPWSGGIAWYYVITAMRSIGPLFAYTLAAPLAFLAMTPTIALVFSPNRPPVDFARKAATRLALRPHQFLANAQDIASLHAFVSRQAPRYRELRQPTVVITGDSDTVLSVDIHARALAAALPRGRLNELPGVGHMPQYVAADVIVDAVEEVAAAARNAAGRAER